MAAPALQGSESLASRDTAFRLEGGFRTSPAETLLYLHGDFDAEASRVFVRYLETGIKETDNRIDVRLDGVSFFGSDASRAVEEIVALAEEYHRDLTIGGLSPLAGQVLDLVGFDNPMVERDHERTVPLSPVVFDAVISKAVLRGREAVCVTTHDVDDPRIVFVNEAFTALTGYAADEALGMNPKELQGPLTKRSVIEELKAAVRSGRPFNGEAVNYRADGSPFWMNWKIVDVSVGVRSFYVAVQRDGTELRQLNLLEAARTRLERVQRRSSEADLTMALDALVDAVALVVESPAAVVTAAVTDALGSVHATSSNAARHPGVGYRSRRVRRILEPDSANLHLPFEIRDGWFGHVRIDDVHPDWLRLVNDGHLETLTTHARSAIIEHLDELTG